MQSDNNPVTPENVDVIILGGGIAGTITSLILAAQGKRVALLDKSTHPRFALGESLLKPTVLWMRLLADRFNVPELNHIASVKELANYVGPTSGVKKCFGFVQHKLGQQKTTDQWWSNLVNSDDEGIAEAHLFRQDVDAYLFRAATQKCTLVRSGVSVQKIDINAHRVKLKIEGAVNSTLTSEYLIDCTGANSLLANQYNLREQPCRFRTESRTNFTHMIGVLPFDDCEAAPTPAINWHEGTLHHLIDDAWIWVIPFDNHADSVNPLVSVGITFYGARLSRPAVTAEQEWQSLLSRYPALQQQFANAQPVRPWIGTDKLEYSSTTSTGQRYCLLGASYGGIDALFSRGLLNTMQSIFLICESLCTPHHKRSGDTSINEEQEISFEALQSNLLEINDLLTSGTYQCANSTQLTTWWLSMWTLIEQQSNAHAQAALAGFLSGDSEHWHSILNQLTSGVSISNEQLLLKTLRSAENIMNRYASQALTESEALSQLHETATNVASLGFSYPLYSNVLKKFGFHANSRVLLQTEYALAQMIDDIDNGMAIAGKLRALSLVRCVIKLLSGQMAKSTGESVITLDKQELQTQLTVMADTWVPDQSKRNKMLASLPSIQSLRYLEHSIGTFSTEVTHSEWNCLLSFSKNGRSTSVQRHEEGKFITFKLEFKDHSAHRVVEWQIDASQNILPLPRQFFSTDIIAVKSGKSAA